MNDRIVFRCMQKVLFTHEDLEKKIDSLVAIPQFSAYKIKDGLTDTLHRLKCEQILE